MRMRILGNEQSNQSVKCGMGGECDWYICDCQNNEVCSKCGDVRSITWHLGETVSYETRLVL